jgi:hypothetical protein
MNEIIEKWQHIFRLNLAEESIVHELLHIVFPEPQKDETFEDYERWITDVAENFVNEK